MNRASLVLCPLVWKDPQTGLEPHRVQWHLEPSCSQYARGIPEDFPLTEVKLAGFCGMQSRSEEITPWVYSIK